MRTFLLGEVGYTPHGYLDFLGDPQLGGSRQEVEDEVDPALGHVEEGGSDEEGLEEFVVRSLAVLADEPQGEDCAGETDHDENDGDCDDFAGLCDDACDAVDADVLAVTDVLNAEVEKGVVGEDSDVHG